MAKIHRYSTLNPRSICTLNMHSTAFHTGMLTTRVLGMHTIWQGEGFLRVHPQPPLHPSELVSRWEAYTMALLND